MTGKVDAMTEKVKYCDSILSSKNSVPVSVIARDYGLSAVTFNRILNALRIQYKVGGTWLLYQKYTGRGYTQSHTYYTITGTAVIYTHWTPLGRYFLYNTLLRHGIVPMVDGIGVNDSVFA